jgi:hypothetical protein
MRHRAGRSDQQLLGNLDSGLDQCDPASRGLNDSVLVPCGLIASSFFTGETAARGILHFSPVPQTSSMPPTAPGTATAPTCSSRAARRCGALSVHGADVVALQGIAWKSDVEDKFKAKTLTAGYTSVVGNRPAIRRFLS